jgi:hypothetical protein
MANHHAPSAGHPAMDYAEHDKTFNLFLGLLKYVSAFVIVLLIFMAIFLL